MKISKVIAISTVFACMATTGTFASDLRGQVKQTIPQKSAITLNILKDNNETPKDKDKNNLKCPDCSEHRKDVLSNLVKSGTITQTQADAIKTALKSARKSDKSIKEVLNDLVKAKTITQAQEDAVLKAIPSRHEKNSPKEHHKGKMNELVSSGTITQAQADAIKTAIKSARKSDKSVKEVLDDLVKAKTITQAQEDAILKVFKDKKN